MIGSIGTLVVFLLLSALTASSGMLFRPGRWYQTLEKPGWTPPKRAFPIVWCVLYVLIAVAGWLAWTAEPPRGAAFAAFGAQLALNFLWSWLFFGLRRPLAALADIALLAVTIAATIALFLPLSGWAALLLLPYLAWVGLAFALNLSVWRLNRGRGAFAAA